MDEKDVVPESVVSSIVTEVLAASRDSVEMKRAGRAIGSSLATIATTVENALLPLAAINYGIEKARQYFAGKFQSDFEAITADIPSDAIVDPKPSVAGPALQGLAFSFEEPDLKVLYLNLLKTSIDSRVSDQAHPSYVEIIKQMSSEEARLLGNILNANAKLPAARIEIKINGGTIEPRKVFINSINMTNKNQVIIQNIEAMINNWCRLGILSIDFSEWFSDVNRYTWVNSHPLYLSINIPDGAVLGFEKGLLKKTQFGENFGRAVGIIV